MTPLANKLAAVARQAADHLGCGVGSDEETFVGVDELGHLEHLIHELCHAVLLDLPIEGPSLARQIGQAIVHGDDDPLRAEASAWAVAWQLWCRLELPFEYEEARIHAAVQGVYPALLAFEMSRDWSAEADAVMQHLERVCLEDMLPSWQHVDNEGADDS